VESGLGPFVPAGGGGCEKSQTEVLYSIDYLTPNNKSIMFNLFKMLRKGSRQQGKPSSFWYFAIAEFVLVVLGILLALQIENWNQNRLERKQEIVLLNEMKVNLQSGLRDAHYNYNYHQETLFSTEVVLRYLEGEIEYHDSLGGHFGKMGRTTFFDENISTYESLKSIGIDLISNDSLRQKLTYLYSARYDYINAVELAVGQGNLINMYSQQVKKFEIATYLDWADPLDPEGIRKDNEYKNHMKANQVSMQYLMRSYRIVIGLIEEIIQLIEMELN
jgi:hypothetical protein